MGMTEEEKIIKAIRNHGAMTAGDIKQRTKIKSGHLGTVLSQLVKKGKLTRTGASNLYKYHLAKSDVVRKVLLSKW